MCGGLKEKGLYKHGTEKVHERVEWSNRETRDGIAEGG